MFTNELLHKLFSSKSFSEHYEMSADFEESRVGLLHAEYGCLSPGNGNFILMDLILISMVTSGYFEQN